MKIRYVPNKYLPNEQEELVLFCTQTILSAVLKQDLLQPHCTTDRNSQERLELYSRMDTLGIGRGSIPNQICPWVSESEYYAKMKKTCSDLNLQKTSFTCRAKVTLGKVVIFFVAF